MGTRSLTIVKDSNGDTILNMYRQMDGYLEGMGADLAEFLQPFQLVNGFGMGDNTNVANGMGCLAAQIVAHFKTDVGGIYLYAGDDRNCGEDYIYTITQNEGTVHIDCRDVYENDTVFSGSPKELLEQVREAA